MKLFSLLVVSGCAVSYSAPIFSNIPIPDQFAGVTICSDNNHPVILVHPMHKGTPNQDIIEVHEQVHVQQMVYHKGGCRGWGEHAKLDPKFALNQELMAFCYSARYAFKKRGQDERELQKAVDAYFLANYQTKGLACPNDSIKWSEMISNMPP